MFRWFSSLVAALLVASPAASVTLTHPDDPVFKACAIDMNVDGKAVAARIAAAGWIETVLTSEIQSHGRDDADIRYFENSVHFGNSSKQDWDAAIAEIADTRDLDPYGNSQTDYPTETRVFMNSDSSGFAIITIEEDGYWSCQILLTVAPEDAAEFMTKSKGSGDATSTEGISYLSDEHRTGELAELLGLIPFMPSPKLYYCDYWLANPDVVKRRYGLDLKVVFSAQFNVISPF